MIDDLQVIPKSETVNSSNSHSLDVRVLYVTVFFKEGLPKNVCQNCDTYKYCFPNENRSSFSAIFPSLKNFRWVSAGRP